MSRPLFGSSHTGVVYFLVLLYRFFSSFSFVFVSLSFSRLASRLARLALFRLSRLASAPPRDLQFYCVLFPRGVIVFLFWISSCFLQDVGFSSSCACSCSLSHCVAVSGPACSCGSIRTSAAISPFSVSPRSWSFHLRLASRLPWSLCKELVFCSGLFRFLVVPVFLAHSLLRGSVLMGALLCPLGRFPHWR